MYDPTNDLNAFANNAANLPVTVGGDAPWWDKGLSALVSLGSAFGAIEVQKAEIKNAYNLAAVQRGIYNTPGGQYTGQTPWLGITGDAPVQPGGGTAGYYGVDPLMLILIVGGLGLGAFILLRK